MPMQPSPIAELVRPESPSGILRMCMLALLAALKREHAVLLVEHDMDAVFRIADRITVMVNGEVIASDTPHQIRSNAQVRVAYLGEGH